MTARFGQQRKQARKQRDSEGRGTVVVAAYAASM